MFWNKRHSNEAAAQDAGQIVSRIGELSAYYYRKHQLVKSRSDLPCSWFSARECFLQAYEKEYRELPDQMHDSYLLIYADLAFFIDAKLSKEFEVALSSAARCRSERMGEIGISEDAELCRRFIASSAIKAQQRKEIFEHIDREVNCPREHLVVLAETLSFCAAQYRPMHDEWVAHANLLSYVKKTSCPSRRPG